MSNSVPWTERLKTEMSEVEIKKQCCRRALTFGLLFSAKRTEDGDVVLSVPACSADLARKLIREQFTREPVELGTNRGKILLGFNSRAARIMLEKQSDYSEYVKCPECAAQILRGIFIAVGSMNSPEKECYIQLTPADIHSAFAAKELGDECGIHFFTGERRGKTYLYAKKREVIEQMLGELGVNNAYFDFMPVSASRQEAMQTEPLTALQAIFQKLLLPRKVLPSLFVPHTITTDCLFCPRSLLKRLSFVSKIRIALYRLLHPFTFHRYQNPVCITDLKR